MYYILFSIIPLLLKYLHYTVEMNIINFIVQRILYKELWNILTYINMELSLKVSMEKRLWKYFSLLLKHPKTHCSVSLCKGSRILFSHMLSGRAVSVGTSISVFSYFYLITHSLIDWSSSLSSKLNSRKCFSLLGDHPVWLLEK